MYIYFFKSEIHIIIKVFHEVDVLQAFFRYFLFGASGGMAAEGEEKTRE